MEQHNIDLDNWPLQQEWWREPSADWLSEKLVKKLVDSGIKTIGELRDAGPERLLEIEGIGHSALTKIKTWLRTLEQQQG